MYRRRFIHLKKKSYSCPLSRLLQVSIIYVSTYRIQNRLSFSKSCPFKIFILYQEKHIIKIIKVLQAPHKLNVTTVGGVLSVAVVVAPRGILVHTLVADDNRSTTVLPATTTIK